MSGKPSTKAGLAHISEYGERFDQWERQSGTTGQFRESVLDIECEARAEVARQVRELPWNVSGSTDDPEWAVSEYRDAVLALLEDAAPRQPTTSTHVVRGREYCRSCDRDLTLGTPHRADCRADLDYPAAPRQPELYASFGEMVRDLNAAAPDTTTGTTDE